MSLYWSRQWSLVWGFVQDFFCISFVWLCSQREVSQTKLMQTKSRTKLYTRLHWLEWLGFRLNKTIVIKPPKDIWPNDCQKLYFPSYHTAAVLCCCAKLAFQKNNGEIAEATVGRTRLMIGTTRCKNEHYAFMKTLKLSVKNTKRWLTTDLCDKHIFLGIWNITHTYI